MGKARTAKTDPEKYDPKPYPGARADQRRIQAAIEPQVEAARQLLATTPDDRTAHTVRCWFEQYRGALNHDIINARYHEILKTWLERFPVPSTPRRAAKTQAAFDERNRQNTSNLWAWMERERRQTARLIRPRTPVSRTKRVAATARDRKARSVLNARTNAAIAAIRSTGAKS